MMMMMMMQGLIYDFPSLEILNFKFHQVPGSVRGLD